MMRWRLVVTNTRQDIQPLTTFKRNSSELMKRMKKTRRPLVLTVQGKAKAVLLDTASYRDVADYLDAVASVRRGLAQARLHEEKPSEKRTIGKGLFAKHLCKF